MSTAKHKGKLIPMVLSGTTDEERAQAACEKLDIEPTGAHETWVDCLEDRGFDKAIMVDGVVYQLQDHCLDPRDAIVELKVNRDQSIDYVASFNDSGIGLNDLLAEAVREKMEE